MIVVFDLDHTLISANSSYCFGAFLFRRGQISVLRAIKLVAAYALHKVGVLSLKGLHIYCFEVLFKTRDSGEFSKLAEQFLDEELAGLLDPEVIKRLRAYQDQGAQIHIFSSSPAFIVESIACRLGIEFVFCTQYATDEHGRFTSIEQVVAGAEKSDMLESIKSKEYTVVFSDSILDAPLLFKADEVVCVNPDKQLLRLALQNSWEVL